MIAVSRIRVLNWLFNRLLKSLQQVTAEAHLKARSPIGEHTTASVIGGVSYYGWWYQMRPVVDYCSNDVLSARSAVATLYTLVPVHMEAHR